MPGKTTEDPTLVVANRLYRERLQDRPHVSGTLPMVATLCGHHAWVSPSGGMLIARGMATICLTCVFSRPPEDAYVTRETIAELRAAGMPELADRVAATFRVEAP